jgi:nucleoside-diphosphate-sugar epimerase
MSQSEELLVTGGTGFIGHALVNEAVKRGYATTILSLNEVSSDRQIKGVRYLFADMTSKTELARALGNNEFGYIVNLGGYIDHSKYLSGGRAMIDVHYAGVLNLLECLNWPAIRSFVQVGSSDEYGNLPAPQLEEMCEQPISSYSVGKVAATRTLQMLHRVENFPAVILRLFLVYGQGQDQKRFLPQIIKGCLNDEAIPTSLGDQLRDFCFIDDIVEGIFLALKSPGAQGEIINLASGQPVSIRTVIQTVRETIGQGQPQFGAVAYRPGENMALYADINKAADLLAWTPTISLAEGLKKTIQYYEGC